MSYRVVPDCLDGFAGQVERAAEAAIASKSYVERYAETKESGPVFDLATGTHTRVIGVVSSRFQQIGTALSGSAAELRAAARYYRDSDTLAAERLDATLPSTASRGENPVADAWRANLCRPGGRFVDARDPLGRLAPVDEPDYSHPLGFLDCLSVSHWANEAFAFVFEFDPIEKVTDVVVGDWAAIAKSGIAIGNTADAVYDIGFDVQGGAISLSGDWEGRAAEAASAYFADAANGAAAMKDPLREISRQYEVMAHGVWSAAEALSGLMKALIDAAIIAGISFAAGTVAIETGVGAVVGYGIATMQVVRMLEIWGAATQVIQSIYTGVQAALGLIEAKLGELEAIKLPVLPGGGASYDHPLVVR